MGQKKIESFFYREDILQPSSWYNVTKNLLDPNYGFRTVSHTTTSALLQRQTIQRTQKQGRPFKAEVILGEENFLGFLSFLKENAIGTRFLIEFFFKPDAHGMSFDFYYDTIAHKFKMFCFESAREIQQYDILKSVTDHFLTNVINYSIIACQANLQKDVHNCALFSYILLRESSKYEDFYSHIESKQIFCTEMPEFQVGQKKFEKRANLANVQWVPVSIMPIKVITSGQSFSEMKENIASQNADEIIAQHKNKFGADKYNTYIDYKRSQYGKAFIPIGNQLFNFEHELNESHQNEIGPELGLYFTEAHSEAIINYLNSFTSALFKHLDMFTQDKTWFTSFQNNQLSINITYKPENFSDITALITFLSEYGISSEAKHEYQMVTFSFSNKKSEINFLKFINSGDIPLLTKFLNQVYFFNSDILQIQKFAEELIEANRINVFLKLFNYALTTENISYSSILSKVLKSNLNARFTNGATWLHMAVINNCQRVLAYLLTLEIDVYAGNNDHLSAIQLAVKQNDISSVQLFMSKQVDFNRTNSCNLLPIHYIRYAPFGEPQKQMFNLLIEKTKLDLNILHGLFILAIDNNNTDIMRFCLEQKTAQGMLDIKQCFQEYANGNYLHYAASHSKMDAVKFLVASGADTEALNGNQKTALDLLPYDFFKKDYLNYIQSLKSKANCI